MGDTTRMSTTRSLRLGALTSAAAVLLGLAVAVAPPALAAQPPEVVSFTEYLDSLGTMHVAGEIRNTGTEPASAHVDLNYMSGGVPVYSEPTDALVQNIAPNGTAPFDAQVTPPSSYDELVIQVTLTPTGREPNHHFSMTFQSILRDQGSTSRQIVGSVRNDNLTPADNVEVVFTFYAADGKAVGGEAIGMEQVGTVQPGASSKFTETSNPDLPEWTRFDYVVQSSTDAAPDPALTPSQHPSGPPETSLDCNPTMTLSTNKVVVGQAVTVNVSGTPGSTVTLEGYSRPSTTYGAIRGGVQLDSTGRSAPFAVKPATNARVRLQVVGCSTPGTGQVITVTPVLTIAAARVGTRTWAFSGKMLPAVQNTGRAITLYYKPATGSPVRKGIAYVAKDGTYRVTLAFTSTKTLQFYFATGSNQTNNAASSNVRTLTTY